jgi:hypothetical protein
MLGLEGKPLFGRLGLETQPKKTPKTPGLLKKKRPVKRFLLTCVSQQDRAVERRPNCHIS